MPADLVAQPPEEEQQRELNRPQTAVEENVRGEDASQQSLCKAERIRRREGLAKDHRELKIERRLVDLPHDGIAEEHDPGGNDEIVVQRDLSKGSPSDVETEEEEAEGKTRSKP